MARPSQRHGKLNRMTSVPHKAGHIDSNPDHDLSHFYRSCAIHHQQRRDVVEPKSERRNSIDHDSHLRAFASIDSAKHIEKFQNAGVSSAASCITLEIPMMKTIVTRGAGSAGELTFTSNDNRKRLSLVSTKEVEKWRDATGKALYRFKPVFTHQFFTNEKIRGYRPTDGAIEAAASLRGMSSNETNQCAHPSFSHHYIAGFTLLIQVRISPSCRKCCLIVEIGKAAKQLSNNEYRPETDSSLLNRIQSGVVSWDGDDESCDGDEDFELKDKFGGRNKRVRSHQPPVRQTRSGTRIGGDSTDDNKKDDCDENFALKVCRRSRSTQRRKTNPTRRSRRMLHYSESNSVPEQSINSSPRQVTDVSDCPSSDEEDECFHRDRLMSSTAYTRSCSTPSSEMTRMKVGTIITQLSAGLPEVAAFLLKDASVADVCEGFKILSSNVKSTAVIENDYLDQPIGDVVREYSREKTTMSPSVSGVLASALRTRCFLRRSTMGDFVITLADMRSDKEACKYHDEVEKLSQWFIERASPINIGSHGGTDADGGFWRVLYLFEKHSQGGASKYSLAGYMTLFFRGLQMIVCQALCLPPYQRSGHGTEMLRTAYEACGGREIQVESPAPSFASLRNRIDYDLVRTLIEQTEVIPRRFTQPSQLFCSGSTPLPTEVLVKVGSKLNITAHQVEIAFDIWKLHELEMLIRNTINSSASTKIADRTISNMEANYKRVIMRTLLKSLRENVDDLNFDTLSKREQSKLLEKSFKTTIVRYRGIIRR